MEEKQVRKFLRRQISPLGWSLTVYYIILNVMVMLTMAVDSLRIALGEIARGANANPQMLMEQTAQNAWGYLAAVLVGFTVLLAWKGWDFFREEVFVRSQRMTLPAFLGITCVFMGCQMGTSLYASVLEAILNAVGLSATAALEVATMQQNTISMFLYASLGAPITEELLFRGFIQRSLLPLGKKFAIFASALLFGLFHGNLVQTPYAFLVGLVLGYVTAEYSIWWAIVLHMINNMLMADLLPRALSLLPGTVGDAVMGLIVLAFAVAALVILIVKRREVKAYITAECMDSRCVRAFFTNAGVIILTVMMIGNMLLMVTPV